MQVANLALERGGRRIVFESANSHRWATRDAAYLDLMLEGEGVAALQRVLSLEGQEVMRILVQVAFDLEGRPHTGSGELTILDERRALVSVPDLSPLALDPASNRPGLI